MLDRTGRLGREPTQCERRVGRGRGREAADGARLGARGDGLLRAFCAARSAAATNFSGQPIGSSKGDPARRGSDANGGGGGGGGGGSSSSSASLAASASHSSEVGSSTTASVGALQAPTSAAPPLRWRRVRCVALAGGAGHETTEYALKVSLVGWCDEWSEWIPRSSARLRAPTGRASVGPLVQSRSSSETAELPRGSGASPLSHHLISYASAPSSTAPSSTAPSSSAPSSSSSASGSGRPSRRRHRTHRHHRRPHRLLLPRGKLADLADLRHCRQPRRA